MAKEQKKLTRKALFAQIPGVAYAIVHEPQRGAEMREEMEAALRDAGCKGDFDKKLRACVSEVRFQKEKTSLEEVGREVIFLRGPNQALDDIQATGEAVAQREHAFAFGDVPVALLTAQSSVAKITLRDGKGNVLRDADGTPKTRPAISTIATPLDTNLAANAASASCGFFTGGRDPKPAEYPYASRSASVWLPYLKPLAGFANYPLWWQGDLLTGEGYHAGSCLMLSCPGIKPAKFTDPKEALHFLRTEWLTDFPFVSEEDFLRALMVPMSLLHGKTTLASAEGPPMFLVNAPHAGTGKSILCNVLIAAVIGSDPGGIAYSHLPNEEREKRIGAALRESQAALFFDNLATGSYLGYRDTMLTQIITTPKFTGRILGSSKMFTVPSTSVPVGNGNNILVDGDMRRRVLEVMLAAPEGETLALRTFKHPNLPQWTRDNRDRILGALRCIMRVKGELPNIGGFPQWFQAVVAPLVIAADASPEKVLEGFIEASEEDVRGHARPGAYGILRGIAGIKRSGVVEPLEGHWHFTRDIIQAFAAAGISLRKPGQDAKPDAEFFDERSLTFFLRAHKGVTVDGPEGAFKLYAERRHDPKPRCERWAFRVRKLPQSASYAGSTEFENEDIGSDAEGM